MISYSTDPDNSSEILQEEPEWYLPTKCFAWVIREKAFDGEEILCQKFVDHNNSKPVWVKVRTIVVK